MQDPAAVMAQIGSVQRTPATAADADSTLTVGETLQLSSAGVRGRSPSSRIAYASADTLVATVSASGLVTARGPGVTIISISSRNVVVSFSLGVKLPPGQTDSLAVPGDTVDQQARPVPPPPTFDGTLPSFTQPMLPAATVTVTVPRVTGRTIRVTANSAVSLQSALNSAVAGDEVVLPNGSVFVGNFTLPVHAGSGKVLVRSETVGVTAGTRVSPSTSSGFATIRTPNAGAALETETSASGWHVMGIRFELGAGAPLNYGIVRLGSGSETTMSQFVSEIVLDRVYITAGTDGQTQRCVGLNGAGLAVVSSWLADCHSRGYDSQAVGGWTGTGPFLIENNWLEGSGQNIMFGGAPPNIPDMTPSDITIRRNYLFKPLSWGNGKWTVKAAFELKHARRVLFEANVIENHWIDAQTGFAILFQEAMHSPTATWTKIADVTVRDCIVRNSASGINILSRAGTKGVEYPTDPSRRVLVQNVLFENVGVDPFSSVPGRAAQLLGDHEDVTLLQNTFTSSKGKPDQAIMLDGDAAKRTLIANNVFETTEYGAFGSGKGEGLSALNFYLAGGYSFLGNILGGRPSSLYPANNFFPSSNAQITYVNQTGGDYTLRPSAVTPVLFGGGRVGVDGARLLAVTANLTRP